MMQMQRTEQPRLLHLPSLVSTSLLTRNQKDSSQETVISLLGMLVTRPNLSPLLKRSDDCLG